MTSTVSLRFDSFLLPHPQWASADAEINVPSVENPELTSALPLKPVVDHNAATHASPTAKNVLFVLLPTFSVLSTSFSLPKSSLPIF